MSIVLVGNKKSHMNNLNNMFKKIYIVGTGIIAILIVILIIQLCTQKNESNEDESTYEENEEIIENEIPDFSIEENTEEKYENNLNPKEYAYYDSEIADFHFSYPTKLYNKVEFKENQGKDLYGNLKQEIVFSGEKGAQLVFKLWERTDVADVESYHNYIYSRERNIVESYEDILEGVYETDIDTHGKIIISGWVDSEHSLSVYDMVKTEEKYVMQMKIIWPTHGNADENLMKNYMIESIYRLCGFSDSSKPCRSYEDYKSASD